MLRVADLVDFILMSTSSAELIDDFPSQLVNWSILQMYRYHDSNRLYPYTSVLAVWASVAYDRLISFRDRRRHIYLTCGVFSQVEVVCCFFDAMHVVLVFQILGTGIRAPTSSISPLSLLSVVYPSLPPLPPLLLPSL